MNFAKHAVIVALALWVAPSPLTAAGQAVSSQHTQLPSSTLLSDVEVSLLTVGGDGCVGFRCVDYRITVHGDGVVELEDLGTPPRADKRRRPIAADDVVSLVNEFLRARFFDARDSSFVESAVRRDNLLILQLSGTIGTGRGVDLTLRLGRVTKTVRLTENVPADLARLVELVQRVGGPQTWPPDK